MPSVGMRKSTRVMVVKGGNGAGHLRSGRPIWRKSGESRLQKAPVDRSEWLNIIKKPAGGNCVLNFKEDCISDVDSTPANTVGGHGTPEIINLDEIFTSVETRMQGVVFTRKRRRRIEAEEVTSCSTQTKDDFPERRMFGKFFVRRKRRKTNEGTSVMIGRDLGMSSYGRRISPSFSVTVDPSVLRTQLLTRILISIVRHSTMAEIRLKDLSDFIMLSRIGDVFSSHGIRFLLGHSHPEMRTCIFFGLCYFLPLFTLDFSAIPSCLLYMQINMVLRARFLPISTTEVDDEILSDSDNDENMSFIAYPDPSHLKTSIPPIPTPLNCRSMSNPRVTFKFSSQHNDIKNFSNSRTFRTRRRSKRSMRDRKSIFPSGHRRNHQILSNLVSMKDENGITIRSHKSDKLPPQRNSMSVRALRSAIAGVRNDIDSSCCCANILIFESDRCYREEGAEIMLELCDSKSWVMAVRTKGSLRISHTPQTCMRPCFSNRFNHAMIWSGDDGWKLEFHDRRDWMVFKELYNECQIRNMQASMDRLIPVPQVRQVQTLQGLNGKVFSRPSSYIVSNNDEISRAMARGAAASNYDIESDDEEWLRKFNADNDEQEPVSVETFEFLIDSFEKAVFCNPCGFSDEQSYATLGIEAGMNKKEVVEAVCLFWSNKRKHRQSPLVKVFQTQDHHQQQQQRRGHKSNPKPLLERRRFLKRPSINPKRVKHRNVGQAVMAAAERDARREHQAIMEAEVAKGREKRMMEVAVEKRLRAQSEMEKADRAIYRATMAVRMAEEADLFGATTDKQSWAMVID